MLSSRYPLNSSSCESAAVDGVDAAATEDGDDATTGEGARSWAKSLFKRDPGAKVLPTGLIILILLDRSGVWLLGGVVIV